MSEQNTGIFEDEAPHLNEPGGRSAIEEVMHKLSKRSADHPGDASRPERFPLVDQYKHLSETQIHVADILRSTEPQVQIVRHATAACALATASAHFLDLNLKALADSMRDEVLDRDDNPKATLGSLQGTMNDERRILAKQYAQLMVENKLLYPGLPVTIDGDPDRWHSTIGRLELARALERLLNTDPDHPDYPKIAQMYFALQRGVEDTTIARVFSPLNWSGKTLDELNERSGVARLPKDWQVKPFEEVADGVLTWDPDAHSFEPGPLTPFRRVVMIPGALGFDSGPIGIPKIPTVSSMM